MSKSYPGTTMLIYEETSAGKIVIATIDNGTPPTTADLFIAGAKVFNLSTGVCYRNTATSGAASWDNEDDIGTSEIADSAVTTAKIADGAITAAKVIGSEARTATSDGTGTGAITAPTTYVSVITVTSANATDQIALPAITSGTIGQIIFLSVASNGYELITPAASNNTINLVDADGTNQLDVAANTTVRCTQVSATSWLAETIAATTITVNAPDND